MIPGIIRSLIAILLPTRCVLCQETGPSVICSKCKGQLEPVGDACVRCGRRRQTTFASPDCGECHDERIGVVRGRSLYVYNEAGRSLLGDFKFRGLVGIGDILADDLCEWLDMGAAQLYGEPDIEIHGVVPVPLHRNRLRKRKYNQSELIARKVARALDVECMPEALARIRETETQVGLSATKRKENVRGAFAVPEGRRAAVTNKGLLIIDDLMTTGATLAACAAALRKGGAGLVYGLTLFSTLRDSAATGSSQNADKPWMTGI